MDKRQVEVRSVTPFMASQGQPERCVVDFKRVGFEAEVDCEEQCEAQDLGNGDEEKAFESCVEDCEHSRDKAEVGSFVLFPDGTVKEATIPASCRGIYGDEMDSERDMKHDAAAVKRKFQAIGCNVAEGSWIHPHEIASGSEAEMEMPAICYYHVGARRPGLCKVDMVLKILEALFR